jgi:hypothetical protein
VGARQQHGLIQKPCQSSAPESLDLLFTDVFPIKRIHLAQEINRTLFRIIIPSSPHFEGAVEDGVPFRPLLIFELNATK